ncbi:LytR/AlgR family response regulator transcription factor [Wenyingzhuangia marina]|uniref:Two component transcriptional regulator, LytTR family n=1 Tax=Wenyingzhuangia marina TaxID=1195760 RepID=A0A1M5WN03_9FLAO|nr:LytTR family DNA-binding domain-containing protein [Wenyingzhuangia marina]GGF79384.1 DNA-binding response regulator [Wenyingzhuangia marina]SHH88868.1 two component transcriptional regulator, LytTR family [Wenyingzhuangia marina]
MKIHNTIIIDDDKSTIEIMNKLCSKHYFLKIEKSFTESVEAFEYVNKNDVDLIFLDIEMPSLNGLDFIKNVNKNINYIIISSKKDYAFNLIGNQNIVGYIHKPINEDSFNKKVDSYINSYRNKNTVLIPHQDSDFIFVNYNRKIVKINVDGILLLESRGDYVIIKTTCKKNYLTKNTLKNFIVKLPGCFIRVHKSYIINISKIDEIENNIIVMGKEHIPISKTYNKILKQNINTI